MLSQDSVRCGGLHPGLFSAHPSGVRGACYPTWDPGFWVRLFGVEDDVEVDEVGALGRAVGVVSHPSAEKSGRMGHAFLWIGKGREEQLQIPIRLVRCGELAQGRLSAPFGAQSPPIVRRTSLRMTGLGSEVKLCRAVQLGAGPLEPPGTCDAGQRRVASSTTRAWRMSASAMDRFSSAAFFAT